MLRTYLYIPEHLEKKINQAVKTRKQSKAEVMREALEKGLEATERNSGAQVLLKIAELARKHHVKGPRDLSVNHDYYLWGGKKRNSRIKP